MKKYIYFKLFGYELFKARAALLKTTTSKSK